MEHRSEPNDLRFADGLAALEALVARLESGELSLEDALHAFEEGVRLVRVLEEKLTVAERRVEILTRASDGSLRLDPSIEEKR